MMRSFTLVLFSASAALAFPGMPNREQMARRAYKARSAEGVLDTVGNTVNAVTANSQNSDSLTDILGDTIGGLTSTLQGLLGSVAEGVLNPDDKRPEPGFEFKEPGPGDSRGPCPGLNLLANYGELCNAHALESTILIDGQDTCPETAR